MKSGTCEPKWKDNGLMTGKIMIAFVNYPEWRRIKSFWYAKALNEDGVLSFIGSYETREAAMNAVEEAAGMRKEGVSHENERKLERQ